MKKRGVFFLLCSSVLAACLSCIPAATAAEARPNVLFIAVDDLNDWIGVLKGHPQSRTPNIDRLAGRGVLFTNAHCAAPACNPSRAALMTGIRPSTSGVYHNPQPWRQALPDAVTLPQHFMQHGYTALGAGKIYHGSYPDPPSWNTYFPSQTKNKPNDPLPPHRPVNGIPKNGALRLGAGRRGRRRNGRCPGGRLGDLAAAKGARQAVLPRLRYLPSALAVVRATQVLRPLSRRRSVTAERVG